MGPAHNFLARAAKLLVVWSHVRKHIAFRAKMANSPKSFCFHKIVVLIPWMNPPQRDTIVVDDENRVVPKCQGLGRHVVIEMAHDDAVSELVAAFVAVVELGTLFHGLNRAVFHEGESS